MDAVRQRARRELRKPCRRRNLFSREIGAPTDSPSRRRACPTRAQRDSDGRRRRDGCRRRTDWMGSVRINAGISSCLPSRSSASFRSVATNASACDASYLVRAGVGEQPQDLVVDRLLAGRARREILDLHVHDQYGRCETLGRLPVSPSARSPARRPTAQGLRRQWASVPTVRATLIRLSGAKG